MYIIILHVPSRHSAFFAGEICWIHKNNRYDWKLIENCNPQESRLSCRCILSSKCTFLGALQDSWRKLQFVRKESTSPIVVTTVPAKKKELLKSQLLGFVEFPSGLTPFSHASMRT